MTAGVLAWRRTSRSAHRVAIRAKEIHAPLRSTPTHACRKMFQCFSHFKNQLTKSGLAQSIFVRPCSHVNTWGFYKPRCCTSFCNILKKRFFHWLLSHLIGWRLSLIVRNWLAVFFKYICEEAGIYMSCILKRMPHYYFSAKTFHFQK